MLWILPRPLARGALIGLLGTSTLLVGSLHARQAVPLPGVTIEFDWSLQGASFRDLHTLNFTSPLEADCVALYGDQALLIHHPGRFELVYALADLVTAIAVIPVGGTDGVLLANDEGLQLMTRQSGPTGFTTTQQLAAGPWQSVPGLWAFPWGSGVRVFGHDAIGSQLLRADYDGVHWTPLPPVPLAANLRDLEVIEWTAQQPGLELAWLFDDDLFVTTGDAVNALVWYPVTPTDSFGVLHATGTEDVLAWVSTWTGSTFLYARGENEIYTPHWIGPNACSDLVAIDRDGDGRDDVVLPSVQSATASALRRGTATFASFPDGNMLELTDTARQVPQSEPIVVATAGDFDNDGTLDLFFGQQNSTASQYVVRPAWEEMLRPYLPSPEALQVVDEGVTQTLIAQVHRAFSPRTPHYHVQVFAMDWTTGILDSVPLADSVHAYDPATKVAEITTAPFPTARVPERPVFVVSIAQVALVGTQIAERHPTRLWLWSPDEEIESELLAEPYPPNTDPEDPGITTGARTGSRAGNEGSGGGPPP